MKKAKFKDEQIVRILAEHEAGLTVAEVCRKYNCGQSSFYKWKAKFGGMGVSDVARLKTLEEENRRLKQMYADLSLHNQMLKDVLIK